MPQGFEAEWLVKNPIPRPVLYDTVPPELKAEYVVEYQPPIRIEIPKGIH